MGWNPTRSSQRQETQTYEGGRAFTQTNPMEELYLLAANTLMMGDTFYESGQDRFDRFRDLVDQSVQTEKGRLFVPKLATYLREVMHLRSIPTVLVAEALQRKLSEAPWAAQRVWVRGDEHLEALAYIDAIGEKRSKNLLRAVAARMMSLTEKQAIKYAAGRKAYSQKDALCVSHPKPGDDQKQNALFKFIRRGWSELSEAEQELLPTIKRTKEGAALTWEQELSAEGQKGEAADKKEAWLAALPKMGYMALLRNLRNFIQADLPEEAMKGIAGRIADPDEVKRSKQLPFRFLVAARELAKANAPEYLIMALSRAMDAACENVPEIDGHTALVVDVSGSMFPGFGWHTRNEQLDGKSRIEQAAMLASIWIKRNGGTVIVFSNGNERLVIPQGTPVAAGAQLIMGWKHGRGGTQLGKALQVAINHNPDRLIVITDEQAHDNVWSVAGPWLEQDTDRKAFVVNVAGYEPRAFAPRAGRVFTSAGFNESVFRWVQALELEKPVETILKY